MISNANKSALQHDCKVVPETCSGCGWQYSTADGGSCNNCRTESNVAILIQYKTVMVAKPQYICTRYDGNPERISFVVIVDVAGVVASLLPLLFMT
jgi:hypothetical protein